MLEAIVGGEQDSEQLAEMSKGLLRNKIPELRLALEGRVTDHHRFLLGQLLDHLKFTESKMAEIEAEIERRMRPFEEEVARLCTLPGMERVTASISAQFLSRRQEGNSILSDRLKPPGFQLASS